MLCHNLSVKMDNSTQTDTDVFQSLNSFTFPRNNLTGQKTNEPRSTPSNAFELSQKQWQSDNSESSRKSISVGDPGAPNPFQKRNSFTLSNNSYNNEGKANHKDNNGGSPKRPSPHISPRATYYRYSGSSNSDRDFVFSDVNGEYSPQISACKTNDSYSFHSPSKSYSNNHSVGQGISKSENYEISKKSSLKSPISPSSPNEEGRQWQFNEQRQKNGRRSWLNQDTVSPSNTSFNFAGGRNSFSLLSPLSPSQDNVFFQHQPDYTHTLTPKRVSVSSIKNLGHRRSLSISSNPMSIESVHGSSNLNPNTSSSSNNNSQNISSLASSEGNQNMMDSNDVISMYADMGQTQKNLNRKSTQVSIPPPPLKFTKPLLKDYQIRQRAKSEYDYKELGLLKKMHHQRFQREDELQNLRLNSSYSKDISPDYIDEVNAGQDEDGDTDMENCEGAPKRSSLISIDTFDDCNTSVLKSSSLSVSGNSDCSMGEAQPLSLRQPSQVVYLVSSAASSGDIDLNVIKE